MIQEQVIIPYCFTSSANQHAARTGAHDKRVGRRPFAGGKSTRTGVQTPVAAKLDQIDTREASNMD